ncbi:MAG: class I SAM-dependent methyltransferase [bacterium]
MSQARQRREREFHEQRSAGREKSLADEALRFEDPEYIDHESWVRDTFELLGNLRGKRVLDYGTGDGMSATSLARRSGEVFAFDIAHGNAVLSTRRARANGVADRVHLQKMAGEYLGYRDEVFDAIYGNAILHHVDLDLGGREMARVLRPGGVAVFSEPWGGNPVLEFVRKYVPYRGKDRTPDEKPLRHEDVEKLRLHFTDVELRGYQLFSMIRRQFRWRPLVSFLEVTDRALLRMFPGLQRYCRYAVIVLRKDGPSFNGNSGGTPSREDGG